MLYELASSKSLDEIDRGLREAAARHKFGVLTVHDIRETLRNKGVDYAADCLVYEVCNPQQAKRALEANTAVSSALPCRISVYGAGGAYRLSTILPTAMMQMLGPGLDGVARDVETEVKAMMAEAA